MHSVFDDFQHFVGRDVVFTHVIEEFLVIGLSLLCSDLLELSFELFDLVFFEASSVCVEKFPAC